MSSSLHSCLPPQSVREKSGCWSADHPLELDGVRRRASVRARARCRISNRHTRPKAFPAIGPDRPRPTISAAISSNKRRAATSNERWIDREAQRHRGSSWAAPFTSQTLGSNDRDPRHRRPNWGPAVRRPKWTAQRVDLRWIRLVEACTKRLVHRPIMEGSIRKQRLVNGEIKVWVRLILRNYG